MMKHRTAILFARVRLWLAMIVTISICALGAFSCGGSKSESAESLDSVAVEDPNVSADTAAFDASKYCCTDHSPNHCAAAIDVEDLMVKHGCKSFSTSLN